MLVLQVSYGCVEALDTCLPHLLEGSPPQPSLTKTLCGWENLFVVFLLQLRYGLPGPECELI